MSGTLSMVGIVVDQLNSGVWYAFVQTVAFVVFFALIARVGPVRAPLFTYVNPVVAIVLGTIVLGEDLTLGLLIGFPLVIFGCWLAATGGTIRVRAGADDLPPRPSG